MTVLPTGTVTFLFTDIEGSTRLLKELGRDRYADVLAEHERLLRAAFAAHAGQVVDTQGDALFVAFRTAADAVAAAVDAQRDLAVANWPDDAIVKVRMGLHTGEPRVGDQRYVGIGVHRAARIAAAGHGGQVLLSSTTRELAEEDLPPGVSIRDMGERRLKDIEQLQHLFQLDIDGLPSQFAQLNTLDVELRRKRRRMYAGSAVIGVLAAAVAIPVFAFGQGGSGGSVTVDGNAVAVIDPESNLVTDEVPVGARPVDIAFGSGSLWVANRDDRSVSRIDPGTGAVGRAFPVGDTPTGLAATDDATWVVGVDPTSPSVSVRRIDPQFETVGPKLRVGNVVPGGPGSVAAFGKTVWIAPSSGVLTRLDPQTGRIVRTIDPNTGPTAIAVGAGAIWVTDRDAGTVSRIDPTGLSTPIAVGSGPSAVALGAGGVWVVDAPDNAVVRVDPGTRAVNTRVAVGRGARGITVGAGSVWVANSGDGTVSRIDPAAGEVSEVIEVGGSPQSLAFADGRIWVTVARQAVGGGPVGSSGGTARLSFEYDVDHMDPALAYNPLSWRLLAATCAKLFNYPDKPAPAGSQLVPEVAQSLPTRSADGKTYVFTIREGFRFSPPSGEAVTAQTFKHAIERTMSPKTKSPGQLYLGDIVGADAYVAGRAPHITGIVARGNRLTIRLSAPNPNLPHRLALPFFCAVPLGTPLDPEGVKIIPAAGPYYVTSYAPGQGVVLERNPNYKGGRPHRLDRIELSVGVSPRQAVAQVEAGAADYAVGGVDRSDAARIAARYGVGSPAARAGKQQYFVNPSLGLGFISLNTQRPLFQDVRLRQAVSYAIDRRALSRIGGLFGSFHQPTDQYLPPTMPGFKDANVYPLTPALAQARRLTGGERRTAVLYTCNRSPCDRLAQVVKTNLGAIGIDVVTKAFPAPALFERLARPGEPYDLTFGEWLADYPDPVGFIDNLSSGQTGAPRFDDPAFRRAFDAVSRLTGPRRTLAAGTLDIDTARNAVPWIAFGTPGSVGFFSARIGCQINQPVYGIDLAALCIRP